MSKTYVEASSEEEARKLLEEEGGMDIMSVLGEITHKDYMNATLGEISEN